MNISPSTFLRNYINISVFLDCKYKIFNNYYLFCKKIFKILKKSQQVEMGLFEFAELEWVINSSCLSHVALGGVSYQSIWNRKQYMHAKMLKQ